MNIIKNNEVLNNLLNKISMLYENEVLEVKHYNKIISLSKTQILLKDIIINGVDIKVIYIDKYLIKLCGNITSIEKRGNINET